MTNLRRRSRCFKPLAIFITIVASVLTVPPPALAKTRVGINVLRCAKRNPDTKKCEDRKDYVYVRPGPKSFTIGALLAGDKFYVRDRSDRKKGYWWGYAEGSNFKGCAWVSSSGLDPVRGKAGREGPTHRHRHECSSPRQISYASFAVERTRRGPHLPEKCKADCSTECSCEGQRCSPKECAKKTLTCPFRVKLDRDSELYRNDTALPGNVAGTRGDPIATLTKGANIGFRYTVRTSNTTKYAMVFSSHPRVWAFIRRADIEPIPGPRACKKTLAFESTASTALPVSEAPETVSPDETGDTCPTDGGSCVNGDYCGDDLVCRSCGDDSCGEEPCTGDEPDDHEECGFCDGDCDLTPEDCSVVGGLFGPNAGSLDCDGRIVSGTANPHGSISIIATGVDFVVAVELQGAEPNFTYSIEAWESGQCGDTNVADTGTRLATDENGDGAETFLLPVLWSPFGTPLGDGQGSESVVVVLDDSVSTAPDGDRFSTNGAVSLVMCAAPTPCGAFLTKWGSYGSGDGQFNVPEGVAVDGSGNVYVADTSNHRIQKFDSSGTFLTKWGTNGNGNAQFITPDGVAVDRSGNVYVSDFINNRVQKFDGSGTFLAKWGSSGSGDGQFGGPHGVAVDGSANANVYVSDFNNSRVQKFDGSGTFLAKWGSYGSGDGQFNVPEGVAVDGSGNVYVADTSNHRIQKFDSSGTFLTKWGSNGSGDGQFSGPHGVAVAGSGNVYVADTSNHRIQKFDSSGTFLSKWGSNGNEDGQFITPDGVAVDGSGNVYVADTSNHRIQKFACQ